MSGPLLPLALAATAAVTAAALWPAAAPPAAPGRVTASVRSVAAPPGPGAGRSATGHPDGAAAAVTPPDRPAAAAPSPPRAPGAGSDPAVRAAGVARPVPGRGWRWPLAPSPSVRHGFDVGPFRWSPGHRGADLVPAGAGGPAGAPVLAAGPGVVRFAGAVAGRGVVAVDHGAGVRTTYEPVAASVTAGRQVAAGAVLGVLQPGGHCGPVPCLHWGAVVAGRYVDPLTLLRPREPPVLLPVPAS